MMPIRRHSLIASFILLAGITACSGQNSPSTEGKAVNEAPAELGLKDQLKNYANYIHKDPVEITAAYTAKFGDKSPTTFNSDFLNFLVATDPAFSGMESTLPSLFTISLMGGGIRGEIRPTRTLVEKAIEETTEVEKLEQAEQTKVDEAAQIEKRKKSLDDLAAFLTFLQGRFIDDAAFFALKIKGSTAQDFAMPDNIFGTSIELAKSDLKDSFTKFFYATTLEVDGQVYSFFQFSPEPSEGESRSFGKFPVFILAKDNVFTREFSRPVRELAPIQK